MPEPLTVRRAIVQSGLVPIDAQVLLAHVLGETRAWLVAHATDALPPDAAAAFFTLAKRRREGEPVAYITGVREFWGLPLRVSRDVLIPRPETETLVEVALAHLPRGAPSVVLDLGTGSGAVALAIAHERPQARVIGTDLSAEALAVAADNAQRLRIANLEWRHSDWFASLGAAAREFDAIVSNPPYVEAGDPHLAGDLRYEPAAALTAGTGLAAIAQIVRGARERLRAGGLLAVEHGYDQAEAVRQLLADEGFADVACARDLAGIARVTFGQAPG